MIHYDKFTMVNHVLLYGNPCFTSYGITEDLPIRMSLSMMLDACRTMIASQILLYIVHVHEPMCQAKHSYYILNKLLLYTIKYICVI